MTSQLNQLCGQIAMYVAVLLMCSSVLTTAASCDSMMTSMFNHSLVSIWNLTFYTRANSANCCKAIKNEPGCCSVKTSEKIHIHAMEKIVQNSQAPFVGTAIWRHDALRNTENAKKKTTTKTPPTHSMFV